MNKTYLRQSHACRTIVARIIGECFTTFARHSCNIRETLARCSPDEIASIYCHRPPHDVLTNVVRLSCDCRAKVVRLSHDGFARNDKPRKINTPTSIGTSDWEGTMLLEGIRGLEGARLLEGVTLLDVGSKY